MDFSLDNNDRRTHERFSSKAMAQYFIKNSSIRYMDCELVDISRSGIGVRMPASETLEPGNDISIEITVPGSLEQITVKGTVQWFECGGTIRAGIRFERLLDQALMTRLMAC